MSDDREFALGIENRGQTWFLSRAASLGNLMRTSSPYCARTWPTVAEVEMWVDSLPEDNRQQIRDRVLSIIPLTILVGPPVGTLTLKTLESEPAKETVSNGKD